MKKISILFIFLFIYFFIYNLIVSPVLIDEIWVYGFTNNIYTGLIPYKDFNIIIPPLYYFIMVIPFYLFGSSMLTFHIENALIITFLLYLVYKLIDKKIILILPFLIFPLNITFPNYNFLLLVLFVLLLYLEKEKKSDFLIGIVLGLMILTKHTVGLFMLLPSLYYFKYKNKMIHRFLGCIIPCLLFLIYLLVSKTLYSFIDLGILGLFDFGNNNHNFFNTYFFIVCIIILIVLYHIKKKKELLPLLYLLFFASIAVPIFDLYHVSIFIIAFMIVMLQFYKIDKFPIYILMISFFFIVNILSFIQCNFNLRDYPNNIHHFEYRYLDKNTINHLNHYNTIIKNNNYKFFIIGTEGYFHKITLDQKTSYLDMPCGGNFGYNGYKKMIKLIEDLDPDTLIFVNKREIDNEYGQIYKELFKYIEDHYKLIDEDDLYYFYKLK